MHSDGNRAVRFCWLALWTLAVGLMLVLLFATLADRPFSDEALRHFSLDLLKRGRQFTREARLIATIKAICSLGTMLWLCFHATGARLLERLESFGRGRLWLGLVAVAAGVTLLTELVELPFAFYLGHLHEKAYGLTRQSPGGWLIDHLLGIGLQLGVSLLFWIPLYWLIRRWPRRWWAPAALLNVAFTGAVVMLAPIVLLPLEGATVRVEDPRLLAMVERLATRAGVEVEAVHEIKVSDKSSRINAMVTGLGPTKRMVFYDTLLQQFHPGEVEVVMAHELAHAAHSDVMTGWLLSGAADVVALSAACWVLFGMVGAGPLNLPSPAAPRGLAALMLLLTLIGQVGAPVQNLVSRRMEVRADRFALEVTGNPKAFIAAFKKLAGGNPGDVDPPPIVEFLSHSHPSIISRIRAAEALLLRSR